MRRRAAIRLAILQCIANVTLAVATGLTAVGALGFVGCGLWWLTCIGDLTGVSGGHAGLAFGLALAFGLVFLSAGWALGQLAPEGVDPASTVEARRRRIWWSELHRCRKRADRGDRPWDRFDVWVDRDQAEATVTVLRAQAGTEGRVVDAVHTMRFHGTQTEEAAEALWDLRRRARQSELDGEAEWRLRRQLAETEQRRRAEEHMRQRNIQAADEYARAQQRALDEQAAELQRQEAITEAKGLVDALSKRRRRPS